MPKQLVHLKCIFLFLSWMVVVGMHTVISRPSMHHYSDSFCLVLFAHSHRTGARYRLQADVISIVLDR